MPSKQNPGVFDCYNAAMIDEPIFVLLGRDPAGPATLRFWVEERGRLGKVVSEEDRARMGAAIEEATEMEAWREANLDWDGEGTPLWKADRITSEGNPVCLTPDQAEARDKTLAGLSRISKAAQKVHDIQTDIDNFDGDRRGHYGALEEAREDLTDIVLALFPRRASEDQPQEMETSGYAEDGPPITGEYADELGIMRTTALKLDPVAAKLADPPAEPDLDNIFYRVTDETSVSVAVLLDIYRDAARRRVTIDGTPRSIEEIKAAFVLGKIMVEMTKDEKWSPEAYRIWDKLRNVTRGVETGSIPALRDFGDKAEDLADIPEMPDHRFAVFHKGERYAYARGLEVSPTHLPKALDRMAKDGWHLLAIFGKTDSANVGFIFERRPDHGVNLTFEGPTDAQVLQVLRDKGTTLKALLNRGQPNAPELPTDLDAEVEIHVQARGPDFGKALLTLIRDTLLDMTVLGKVRITGLVDGQTERGFALDCANGSCSLQERGNAFQP